VTLSDPANDVRVEIYRSFVEDGSAPSPDDLAATLGMSREDVGIAVHELAEHDVIELQPGSDRLWLAHPFASTPSPFVVEAGRRRWDAICVWDAFGVLALMDVDGAVTTNCPDCGEPISVMVRDGEVPTPSEHVAHFEVPASRWHEDIGYT
jgi:alkylmercury lyase-like protein